MSTHIPPLFAYGRRCPTIPARRVQYLPPDILCSKLPRQTAVDRAHSIGVWLLGVPAVLEQLWKASDGLDHGTGHFATRRSTLRLAVVDSVALAVYQVKRDGCHRLKRVPQVLALRP